MYKKCWCNIALQWKQHKMTLKACSRFSSHLLCSRIQNKIWRPASFIKMQVQTRSIFFSCKARFFVDVILERPKMYLFKNPSERSTRFIHQSRIETLQSVHYWGKYSHQCAIAIYIYLHLRTVQPQDWICLRGCPFLS